MLQEREADRAMGVLGNKTILPRHAGVRLAAGLRHSLLVVVLLLGQSPITPAQSTATEQQVKAAFVLNFTDFVEWPAGTFPAPSTPVEVCVLGPSTFLEELKSLAPAKKSARPFHVSQAATVDEVRRCHVVFVPRERIAGLGQLPFASENILTVGESAEFVRAGGVIRLVLDNDRLRFEVNLAAAERSHLRVSSRLLAIARVVYTGPEEHQDERP